MTTLHPPACWTLTVKQACALLGISRSKIYYLIDQGSPYYDPTFPPLIRIGQRAVRIDRQALLAWYARQQAKSVAVIETVLAPPLSQSERVAA